ncbi:MAG TPA: hypothetical protein VL860_13605 [Planctomycetota bacterium]|jgi:hypothetical protein|nr:hypothetical protein [Planctomycetota bacterium]
MDRFRIDSINQMAIKQIAAVQLSDGDGPFVLGRPDPALKDLAPDQHPLSRAILRLMHDEALDVEQQNHLAALTVQVVHFGDIDPVLQHVYATVLGEGRPQHVVTLKLNKVLRDALHLAHAHQEDFQKIFAGGDVRVGSAPSNGGLPAASAAPAKPNPEKQQIIMVQEEPSAIPGSHWSRIRSPQGSGQQSLGATSATAGTERRVAMDRSTISPGMVTLFVDLLTVPISIGVAAHVGMTTNSDDGWKTFFMVLLPSLVIVTFAGAIAHWVWKYMQEEHS